MIGVLADERAVRALVRGWLAAGCPVTRLHLFARIGIALDRASRSDPEPDPEPARRADLALPLVRLARHDSIVLWVLEKPAGERRRSTRRARRRRRALTLLGRLVDAGATIDWPAHARALDDGRPLCVAPLGRGDSDPAALVRPLLAHAAAPVRVRDLANAPSSALRVRPSFLDAV